MSNRELSKLYKETVAPKGRFVESRHIVRGYSESVTLYRKKGDDYELVGDVDDEYYDNTLSRYIKLGSPGSAKLRKQVQEILEKSDADTTDNVNIFQSYLEEGRFIIDDELLKKGEELIDKCITDNEGIMLDSFIEKIYGSDIIVGNKYFNNVWSAMPATAVMGRAGEGELFLAFFCNGIKPDKGDLKVGSENIEIKGYSGRLYKSQKINAKEARRELVSKRIESNEELLDGMAEMIGKLAGTEEYNSGIKSLLESEDIRSEIIQNYKYLKQNDNLPALSISIKIAGTVQLLAYKKAQKFDSIIAFNNKLGGNNIWLQFINLKDIDTIEDMWNRISSLPSNMRFSVHTDGNGFQLRAGIDKNSNMMSKLEQDYGVDLKSKRISARKVDTKDKRVGSLLDAQ